jgi:hypothetical protein
MPKYAIIPNVSLEEFRHLKAQESRLIEKLQGPNVWSYHKAQLVKDIKTTLKYNPDRKMVGIYIEKNGQYQLAEKDSDGSLINDVAKYYQTLLEEELTLMIPKENWVDKL